MSRPSVASRLVRQARDPERPGEYEDALEIRADEWPVRAALADGATESMYAKRWADALVQGLVSHKVGTEGEVRTVASTIQEDFHDQLSEAPESQPWYVTAKETEGAYATVLSLAIERGGTWRAVSIGDCCVFHVREDRLQTAWPIDSAEAFGHRPDVFPSLPSSEVPQPHTASGEWTEGDSFVLATDAVAQWLLREGEEGNIWSDIIWREKEDIEAALLAARQNGDLQSDDATLLILDV